ncbi:MAG: DUF2834 domain-containing protein [Aquabacterium sp.]|nr:MAG: DUF2834 domain-containing protein [Aquabacterium sp.]
MPQPLYRFLLAALALGFAAAFCVIVVPPLWASRDVFGALAAGFVNPYASGYSLDTICCWGVLAVWVVHEARSLGVRHGWIALLLGLAPGVATGFATYLLLRAGQVRERRD